MALFGSLLKTRSKTGQASEDLWSDVRDFSKHKTRSLETSLNNHLPKIAGAKEAISVVFLGDSMFERMTTTEETDILPLWPSETLCSEEELKETNLRRKAINIPKLVRINGLLNAGCGGDKIENILYRLIGDPERELAGLAEALFDSERHRNVKLWVVQAGTNNLHPKKGLTDASVDAYRELLDTILEISSGATRVLVTGLFNRKDINEELVAQANAKLKKLVEELALELSPASKDSHTESTNGVKSVLETHADAPQAAKVEGKGKAVDPGERHDSAIGVAISPTATRDAVKTKEAVRGTQDPDVDTGEGPSLTGQGFTMPQSVRKDHEAVGISNESRESTGQDNTKTASTEKLHKYITNRCNYTRIQYLPAPEGNDPKTWLEDQVHLHEEGYRLWTKELFPKVNEMLSQAEEASS